MMWRNTGERYGAVARVLHWTIAVLIISTLFIGLILDDVSGPEKFTLFRWHKSFGITVLALATIRIFWRFSNIHPAKLPTHAAWEKFLASVTHFLLYFAMIAMPMSGWLMSSAKGVKVSVYGLFTLPDLIAPNKPLGHLLNEFHVYTGWTLIALISLHALGAVKHHFLDKDETMRRMLLMGRLSVTLVFLLLGFMFVGQLLLLPSAAPPQTKSPPVSVSAQATPATIPAAAQAITPAPAGITQWAIDHDQSKVIFETTQNDAPFTGTFAGFDGTIAFDPDRLADSRVSITIKMAGASTGYDERDKSIGDADWFAVDKFPESIFTVDSFEKKGEGQYVAHGKLTLKGVTLPVDLPFTLTIEPGANGRKTAKMQGETTLQRLDYGIGSGQWADPHSVGTAVKVKVLLQAHSP